MFDNNRAVLEDVIAIISDEFPETKGLFQTLLGLKEFTQLIRDAEDRRKTYESS